MRVLERKRLHRRFHRLLADRQRLIEDDTPRGGDDQLRPDADADPLLELDHLGLESKHDLVL